MNWKDFVHEIIIMEFGYIETTRFSKKSKEKLRQHLLSIEELLVDSTVKRWRYYLQYEETLKKALSGLDEYMELHVVEGVVRKYKSPTRRKLDDTMAKVVKSISNRCRWYLSGNKSQQEAVLKEIRDYHQDTI
jgi:hypothetical protein